MQDSILILTFGGGKGLQPPDSRLQYVLRLLRQLLRLGKNWIEWNKLLAGCGCGFQAVAKYIFGTLDK